MSEVTYVPSIKRARLNLATAAGVAFVRKQAPVRTFLDFGTSTRVVLNDVSFQLRSIDTSVRIGKTGLGLLTENFYPLGLFNTKPRQEFGVWEFAKPYRIYPGERLSAAIEYNGVSGRQGGLTRNCVNPAIQFNGVRVSDQRPILLHDCWDRRMIADGAVRLVAEKLQCPMDTPVDLYSCVAQPTMDTVVAGDGDLNTLERLMIYGPDGRQWWDDNKWPYLLDPVGVVMDLNKPEWVLQPGESFYCEFITESLAPNTSDIIIVLRGQVEVTK
jgi:hypothetical protein